MTQDSTTTDASGPSVDRHLRIAGGNLTVGGPVNQDVLAGGGSLDVTSAARVGGDLIFSTGSATMNGAVDGSVLGFTDGYASAYGAALQNQLTPVSLH